jgi:hypothetical protein
VVVALLSVVMVAIFVAFLAPGVYSPRSGADQRELRRREHRETP